MENPTDSLEAQAQAILPEPGTQPTRSRNPLRAPNAAETDELKAYFDLYRSRMRLLEEAAKLARETDDKFQLRAVQGKLHAAAETYANNVAFWRMRHHLHSEVVPEAMRPTHW